MQIGIVINKDQIYSVGKAMNLIAKEGHLDENMDDVLKMDLRMFLSYLAISDGHIDEMARSIISNTLDHEMSISDLINLIKEEHVLTKEYENTAPKIIQFAIAADNAGYDKGIELNCFKAVFNLFMFVGDSFISFSKGISENGRRNYELYLNMLKEYRKNNDKNIKAERTSSLQNDGECSPKKGVPAPKKG